ncbi:hypothetical protein ACF0H5_005309 [Mactra antiquata]
MMTTEVRIEVFPPWLHVISARNKEIVQKQRNTAKQDIRQQNQRTAYKTQYPRKNTFWSTRSNVSNASKNTLSVSNLFYTKSINSYSQLRPKTSISTLRGNDVKSRDDHFRKTTEICRISYPCNSGCAACAFSNCFGPVKIHISQYSEPKQCVVREILDGQGRAVIPKSRRKEFRGLIYDKQTCSLYPPLPKGYTNSHLRMGRRPFY